MSSPSPWKALLTRDLRLAARRQSDAGLPLIFFVVAAGLFPLGVGADSAVLRHIAPGVVWVCALLAALLSVNALYASDFADGTLEQMLISGQSMAGLALVRSATHWILTGLPLVLVSPVLGLMFSLDGESILVLLSSLLLGTPVLSLLGNLGAALTLGVRSGSILLFLLVIPLAVPVLIFGSGAVVAVEAGLESRPHLSLLGALLLATLLLAPWASGAALRIAAE